MKKFLIFVLLLIIAMGIFLAWLFQREVGGVPILSYHQINNIDKNSLTLTVEEFDEQIKYLVDHGYNFITPDELLDAWDNGTELPSNPVIITFDDGYVDTFKNAFPILQKYNAHATMFVVTDFLNLYPNYMTWKQAREMQSSGLVDIESHTLSHYDLTGYLSTQEIRNQLYSSKQAIEWYLKKPAKYIAYPGGNYTREVESLTHDVGYRAAFTVDYGLSHKEPQHYILPRIPIFGNTTYPMLRFQIRLHGAPIIAPLTRFKNRLIRDGNGAIAKFIWIP